MGKKFMLQWTTGDEIAMLREWPLPTLAKYEEACELRVDWGSLNKTQIFAYLDSVLED